MLLRITGRLAGGVQCRPGWLRPSLGNFRPNKLPMVTQRLAHNIGILVSDFDDTLSTTDTVSVLFSAAVEANRLRQGDEAAIMLQETCSNLSRRYMQQFEKFMQEHMPKDNSDEFDQERVEVFLSKLSAFDREMVDIVEESGVLKGISASALQQVGRDKVHLKQGSTAILQKLLAAEVCIHVLSVNWSADLIRGALQGVSWPAQSICIHSNTLEVASGLTVGGICKSILCADDKLQRFKEIQQGCDGLSLMVGDSMSDLGCLLEADFGIVIGQSSSLRKFANASGIKLLPIQDGDLNEPPRRGIIYYITEWNELHRFLALESGKND